MARRDEARPQKLDALKAHIRAARDRLVDYDAHYAGMKIDAALLPGGLAPDDDAALDDGIVHAGRMCRRSNGTAPWPSRAFTPQPVQVRGEVELSHGSCCVRTPPAD